MRWYRKNVITEEEAAELSALLGSDQPNHVGQWEHPIIKRLANLVTELTGAHITRNSCGCRITTTPSGDGILPHDDTNIRYQQESDGSWTDCSDHRTWQRAQRMKWCRASASCRLSLPDSSQGGVLYYGDPDVEIAPEDHYRSICIHTSDEIHGVTPITDGERCVLLMFMGDAD